MSKKNETYVCRLQRYLERYKQATNRRTKGNIIRCIKHISKLKVWGVIQ